MKETKNKIDVESTISREHYQILLWLPYNARSGLYTHINGGITLF